MRHSHWHTGKQSTGTEHTGALAHWQRSVCHTAHWQHTTHWQCSDNIEKCLCHQYDMYHINWLVHSKGHTDTVAEKCVCRLFIVFTLTGTLAPNQTLAEKCVFVVSLSYTPAHRTPHHTLAHNTAPHHTLTLHKTLARSTLLHWCTGREVCVSSLYHIRWLVRWQHTTHWHTAHWQISVCRLFIIHTDWHTKH